MQFGFKVRAACDCCRHHSVGEALIKTYLENNNIPYKAEQTFDNLCGLGGRALRYDFAVLDEKGDLRGLIEFDGLQHYQEAGAYFNETGIVQVHDDIKDEYAKKHGIPLLRIPYWKIRNTNNLVENFIRKL